MNQITIVDARIIVKAFLTKCFVLSHRCNIRFLGCGTWYAGNSIMNGGTSPFIVVALISSTQAIATTTPRMYIQ